MFCYGFVALKQISDNRSRRAWQLEHNVLMLWINFRLHKQQLYRDYIAKLCRSVSYHSCCSILLCLSLIIGISSHCVFM